MLDQLIQFCETRGWNLKYSKTLLAVSGGIDSVVLAHLFNEAGFPFAIAHCNFQLRGAESDDDERFVGDLAKKLGAAFFIQKFRTAEEAGMQKQSIQMVARRQRYHWFETIRKSEHFHFIATAHHLDDSIETVLYNFTKGCGIRGLHGIPVENGQIIRPLLFLPKKEILTFAKKQHIDFREDSSNSSDKYSRNLIRKRVIPVLEKINPNFQNTALENFRRIRETEFIFEAAIEELRSKWMKMGKKADVVHLEELKKHPARQSILYEFLKTYGFNNHQCKELIENTFQSGGQFYSETHRLVIDRGKLRIDSLLPPKKSVKKAIHFNDREIDLDNQCLFLSHSTEKPKAFSGNPNLAVLALEKLDFPLTLRRWEPGDYFCPLGMKGKRQKLQDFFVNNKFSLLQKESTWVLESGGEVCWIVGHRIDERFKVDEGTQEIILMKLGLCKK